MLKKTYISTPKTAFSMAILTSFLAQTIHGQVPVGTAFTYQGKLTDSSGPVEVSTDFQFRLYDDPDPAAPENQIGTNLAATLTPATDGTFTVDLDFGASIFDGNERWLEIDVFDGVEFVTLTPRQPIMPAPYALFALNAPSAWLDKGGGNIAYMDGNIGIGVSPPAQALHVGGNVRVDGWIGTDVFAPVEIFVNNSRALLIEDTFATCPNLIGGYFGNSTTQGVRGATIGGGGEISSENRITDHFGTIGGGTNNQAGDGTGSANSANYATVGGGISNFAKGRNSTIGGGNLNTASGNDSSIGGGVFNTAAGRSSAISGGLGNEATGDCSSVPGGHLNQAGGQYSLAAGQRAFVRDAGQTGDSDGDEGTFVWSDSTTVAPDVFESTGPNQFLINAAGGVGIGTNAPVTPLHVAGQVRSDGANGGIFNAYNPDNQTASVSLSWFEDVARIRIGGSGAGSQNGFDFQRVGNQSLMRILDNGNIGIGTTSPSEELHVVGDICATGTIGACSDQRYKKNIEPIHDALNTVQHLHGVKYNWRIEEFPNQQFDDDRQIGFIAQEVKDVLPEVISIGNDGYYSVDYAKLTPVLVEAVKELRSENEDLRARMELLEALVQSLASSNKSAGVN